MWVPDMGFPPFPLGAIGKFKATLDKCHDASDKHPVSQFLWYQLGGMLGGSVPRGLENKDYLEALKTKPAHRGVPIDLPLYPGRDLVMAPAICDNDWYKTKSTACIFNTDRYPPV